VKLKNSFRILPGPANRISLYSI